MSTWKLSGREGVPPSTRHALFEGGTPSFPGVA